ncbi:RFA1 [Enterospora canceri]|uniref:Replication protein A subunit n=1 Tax=Enterospora canceri TaxID=1081671 RepID=A0A1Y1S675_9MICR|nr:RFA1 [Enterospora canceri]
MEVRHGTILALIQNKKDDELYRDPVVQINAMVKIKTQDGKSRYYLNLSDGRHFARGIFSSQLSMQIENGQLKENMVVRLGLFSTRQKDTTTYLLVNTILAQEECDHEIGSPVSVTSEKKEELEKKKEELENKKNTVQGDRTTKRRKSTEPGCLSIRDLNPFLNSWAVRGRVVDKSTIRKFNTKNGEGQLFSFEIIDHTQQCKVVCFGSAVEQFHPLIENNRVYRFTQGVVKMANKNYSSNNFDYEIHLEEKSTVELIDDTTMPEYCFKFKKVSEIETNKLVDVVAVIKEVYPSQTITVKSSGKEVDKRDMVVYDETGSARVTLWGEKAAGDYEKGTVAVFKGFRASEYNGIALGSVGSAQILVNHDIREVVELTAWYETVGKNVVLEKPRASGRRQMIGDLIESNAEFGVIWGTVVFVKEDQLLYTSCPSDGCTKKVTQEENGEFRCEKCNEVFAECGYRYMVTMCVSDFTGQFWMTAFDNAAQKMLGMGAKELNALRETDLDEVAAAVKGVVGREFTMKLRIRDHIYNEEVTKRVNCLDADSVDKKLAMRQMLHQIDKADGM